MRTRWPLPWEENQWVARCCRSTLTWGVAFMPGAQSQRQLAPLCPGGRLQARLQGACRQPVWRGGPPQRRSAPGPGRLPSRPAAQGAASVESAACGRPCAPARSRLPALPHSCAQLIKTPTHNSYCSRRALAGNNWPGQDTRPMWNVYGHLPHPTNLPST